MESLDLFILLSDQIQSCQDWDLNPNECMKLMIDIITDFKETKENSEMI